MCFIYLSPQGKIGRFQCLGTKFSCSVLIQNLCIFILNKKPSNQWNYEESASIHLQKFKTLSILNLPHWIKWKTIKPIIKQFKWNQDETMEWLHTWSRGKILDTNGTNPLGVATMLLRNKVSIFPLGERELSGERHRVNWEEKKTSHVLQHGTENNNSKQIKCSKANHHCPLWSSSFTAETSTCVC